VTSPDHAPSRACAGSVAIEFALGAPILLLLLAGVIDLGMAVHNAMALENAVHVGVQTAVTMKEPTVEAIRDAVKAASGLAPDSVTVTPKLYCECPSTGRDDTCTVRCPPGEAMRRYASVSATQSYTPILPLWGIGQPMTLNSQLRLRLQ